MSFHKLTAGDGYLYLTRQVAASDQTLQGKQALGDYYSEKGERPGSWLGSGLAHLDGVEDGDTVTAAQMMALFGEGRHPNAEVIEAQARAAAIGRDQDAKKAVKAADRASRLGRTYDTTVGDASEFVVECARAYQDYNVERGAGRNVPIPDEARAEIRTRVATNLFTKKYGRPPAAGGRELSGFIARESRPREQTCAGFDLTFSPVKSVSALWAVADRQAAGRIEEAHEAAVRDTIAWLEREVIYTRRGAGGVRVVDVDGVLATAFVHRDSRAGDPDLHTHVAIANKVRDPEDGAWLAIDGQVLYKHIVAASERYNTRLEAELTARLGVSWRTVVPGRGKRAIREIDGVNDELIRRWSRRRADVERRLAELSADFQARHGRVPSAKEAIVLAQQANLETREAKQPHRSHEEQRTQWRAEAVEVLGGERAVDRMVADSVESATDVRRAELTEDLVQDLAEEALQVVEGDRARFQEAHVRAEVERLVRAQDLRPDVVDRAVEAVTTAALGGSVVVELTAAPEVIEPAEFLRRDGSSQYAKPRSSLWTTRRVLDAEERLVAASLEKGAHKITDFDVSIGLLTEAANGINLNPGQQTLVRSMATSGAWLQLALAPAGSGKTTAMRALATAWRNGGGEVYALAPSAAAAQELGAATGTRGETLAKLVWDFDHPAGDPAQSVFRDVDERSLIIVDEAGMASTPDLERALAFARSRGAAIRLIGDDQQLAAIGAGGVLRDIATTAGAATLTEIVRFHTPGEAEASLALRDGRAEEALGFYLDQDRVRVTSPMNEADDIYQAWSADRAAGLSSLMVAANHDLVNELNGRARLDRLAHDGPAGRSVALHSGLEASVGDTIVTRLNDRRLRISGTDFVKNGDRWTVLRVHRNDTLTVRHNATGRRVRLPADYVAANVDLGYATTIHGAQGQTVDTCYALLTGAEDRQRAYVALSRGRRHNTAFVTLGGDGDPHSTIRPDAVIPPTATDRLRSIFGRDGSTVSATTTAREQQAPEVLLRDEAAIYDDALGRAAELAVGRGEMTRLAEQAEQTVPGITGARTWQQLAQHLAIRQLDGEDAIELLADAARAPVPPDSHDLAAVHLGRLHPSLERGGPLPWLHPVSAPIAAHPEYGDWLAQRAQLVVDHAEQVRATALGWTVETAPSWAQRLMHDPDLVADLAVWRAVRGVEDSDLRAAGAQPSDRYPRRHHTRLNRRIATALTNSTETAAHWWATKIPKQARVLADPWWPILADRLDDLAADPQWAPTIDLGDADEILDIDERPAAPAVEQVPLPEEPPHPEEPPPPDDPHDVSRPVGDAPSRPGQHQPPDPEAWVRRKQLNRTVAMHESAEQFYRSQLDGSWVPEYLRSRGLDDLLQQPHLGYAPGGPRALVDHLRAQGYADEEILEAGLASMSHRGDRIIDRFRDRMMLTIRIEHPERPGTLIPVGMAGRAAPDADKKIPKYLNTAATPAYDKSAILYGLAENADRLRAGAVPVLVEGYLDAEAITLASGGRAVGLASGGTALTERQVDALGDVVDLPNTAVVVATDNDHAGRVAATRAWHLLVDAGVTNPRAASLGEHNDPADVLRHDGADALTTGVTTTTTPLLGLVVDHKLDQWGPAIGDNPFAEINALRAIAPHIARADTAQQIEATVHLYARLATSAEVIDYELGIGDRPPMDEVEREFFSALRDADPASANAVDPRPGTAGVKALLRAALADPLPDDHPAAALWSRVNVLATAMDRIPTGASSAERQLLDVVSIPTAARVMTTPQWPAIAEHVSADLRAGRSTTLRDALEDLDPHEHGTPESFAQAVLRRLAPPAEPSQPDADLLESALEQARQQQMADQPAPTPEQSVRRPDDERRRRQDPPAAGPRL